MNPTKSQPRIYRIMATRFSIKMHALGLALSTVFAGTSVAADGVPYDLGKETYKTETLFSYDGCMDHRLMGNSGQPKVFKNHVYLAIVVHGRRVRILQVPLDGGEAKIGKLDPDYVIAEDSHQVLTLGVDKAGYIHLTGGMHGGPWKYWISAKPEDVSKFVRLDPEQQGRKNAQAGPDKEDPKTASAVPGVQGPPGHGITYPHFYKDTAGDLFLHSRASVPSFQKGRDGKIVHVGLLSTYDAAKREWRVLGADIPKEFGGTPGHPATVWEDNFENGPAGGGWYVVNGAQFASAPDNTLHFCFTILNYSSPTGMASDIDDGSKHAAGKDILYAMSKDGGRTLQRANGSKVEWPVRAEAGPYQPDVIYAAAADYAAAEKNGGLFPGLVGGKLELDWKNRPMIMARKRIPNEDVAFRLENGKWVPCPAKAFGQWRDNAGVLMKPTENKGEIVRLWDEQHTRVVKLGQSEIEKLDEDYLRDTGTMVYTTKKGGNSGINVVRTTIERPATPKSK